MMRWSVLVMGALLALCSARSRAPLIDEDGNRTRNKAAECVFGKQVRELGTNWIPDLGTPIGILYCMKCECVPIQRKRRIVARVQCRSIKNECPEPTCEEPVHLPGRCCKTCPGDTYDADVIQDIVPQSVHDEEENKATNRYYTALLTERSSLVLKNDFSKMTNPSKSNVVATGRFNFHKKNLYYSFYISDNAARPRSLQFIDKEGNILEEFVLSGSGGFVNSVYQNATGKVCGVWQRIPHDYRKRLRQEKMYVALVWGIKDQAEFTLSGQVIKHESLATEDFSSLLEPAGVSSSKMVGAGGTAIVTITTQPVTAIHMAIIFNGIFSIDDAADVPINVTLSAEGKKENTQIFSNVIKVKKPNYEVNIIQISQSVNSSDLKQLTRGRTMLTVSSVSKPDVLRLKGSVMTKVSCELFQAALAPPSSTPAGYGLAWLYLNNEGSMVYNIKIEGLKTRPNTKILVLSDSVVTGNKKRLVELEDLTPSFDFPTGWANGTLSNLGTKVVESLYSGRMEVNVKTADDDNLISGKLVGKPVADARDAPFPFLLKRESGDLPMSAVGLAWLSIDSDCLIHYDVSLSGLDKQKRRMSLSLELLPMFAPDAPKQTIDFDDFEENHVSGSPIVALNRDQINRLETGVGLLKVTDKETNVTLMVATIQHVVAPPSCQPSTADNDVRVVDTDNQNGACLYEGKFHDEGTQWVSGVDTCTMCFCQNGANRCFTMTCPKVECPFNTKLVQVPGECCPICVNATTQIETNRNVPQKCIFNGQPYSPGSKFHPFLIPTGFDQCTLCTCNNSIKLEINCTRISNEKECCSNCDKEAADDNKVLSHRNHSVEDQSQILAEGGCKNAYDYRRPYRNGTEYHPFIDSLGEYKCVTCKCQNGVSKCWRECDRAMCEKRFKMKKRQRQEKGNPKYNSCCSPRECKKYRHMKNHRIQKS